MRRIGVLAAVPVVFCLLVIPAYSAKPGISTITISVDPTVNQHPISPYIYGVAFADQTFLQSTNLTLDRWGGNSTSRYNWNLGNASNVGAEYYFENFPWSCTSVTPSCAVDEQISADRAAGSASLITIPTIGWVAKNADYATCGFDVSKYGPQQSVDPYHINCGNGVASPGGQNITGNNPMDTSIASSTSDAQAWVQHLVATFGSASHGGVRFYAMDNEPDLWYYMHRDVAPNPVTYAAEYNEFQNYASVVKSVDPSAFITGPVSSGWSAFFDSAYDYVNNTNTDKASHGGLDFVPWFLQSVQQHDTLSGRRTLNELDVHWFPQGGNVSGGATDSTTDALRLRETRNLWDMTYSDESWIATQTYLIPRMQAWVDQYYPGTKLGISEWNYGADNDINGALAIANVLGIYGWQGLYSANYWKHPATGSPGQFAFEMYRNYDGAGSSFGDVSIQAASNTPGTVLSFGSVRSFTGQVILMVVNEDPSNTESASITLNNVPLSSPVQVYQYSAADLTAIVHLPNIAAANPLPVSLPPYSITELVMGGGRKGGHGTPTPVSGTPTPTPTPVASRHSRVTPTPTGGGPTSTPTPVPSRTART